jgi:hypothetical protein
MSAAWQGGVREEVGKMGGVSVCVGGGGREYVRTCSQVNVSEAVGFLSVHVKGHFCVGGTRGSARG